jgi:sortase A
MSDVQDDRDTAASGPTAGRRRRRGRRRGRRPTFWVGLGLVAAGLSVLGWIGWQLYGTNVVAQHRHEQTVARLEQAWAAPGDRARAAVETPQGVSSAIRRIPALGADYAVPVVDGIDDDALASGVGRFGSAPAPGGVGNYALAGHRITHGEPLRDMPSLAVGDEVVVETRDTVYTYVLDTGGADLRVPFTAGWVVDPRPVNPDGGTGPLAGADRLITLTTCAELFHTDDRLVAFGHLVSAVRR